jgi:putative hydrolase of HD superfamily
MMQRLEQQFALLMELNKLKNVLRKIKVKTADNRFENSAEHSWHVALMAVLLQEYANEPVDIKKVMTMLLIHDVVEIDAGDTFAYDVQASESQFEQEKQAAKRLFGLLPADQSEYFYQLWCEFEQASSAEAKFAKALDRMIPILLNINNQGQSWQEHQISKAQVIAVNQKIQYGSEVLWSKCQALIDEAVAAGWLKNEA